LISLGTESKTLGSSDESSVSSAATAFANAIELTSVMVCASKSFNAYDRSNNSMFLFFAPLRLTSL
jgi:hypothetical protein